MTLQELIDAGQHGDNKKLAEVCQVLLDFVKAVENVPPLLSPDDPQNEIGYEAYLTLQKCNAIAEEV